MDPLNLILLIAVVLIGLRLRSVLGMRHDDEEPSARKDAYRLNRDAFQNREDEASPSDSPRAQDEPRGEMPKPRLVTDNDAPTHAEAVDQDAAEVFEPAAIGEGRGLAFLHEVEPDFDEAGFLDGAGRAYEMILTAFAKGELDEVRGFLGDEVAAGFDAAIAARQNEGQKLVTRILRLDRPALDDARIEPNLISLDVRFRAELISFTCAAGTEPNEDALPAPATAHDVWTFARPRDTQDPNWALVATQSP